MVRCTTRSSTQSEVLSVELALADGPRAVRRPHPPLCGSTALSPQGSVSPARGPGWQLRLGRLCPRADLHGAPTTVWHLGQGSRTWPGGGLGPMACPGPLAEAGLRPG